MNNKSVSEENAFNKLWEIAINWEKHPSDEMKLKLDIFFTKDLSSWSRVKAYKFLNQHFLGKITEYSHIDEEFFDYLYEAESAIVGFVAPDCVLRFSDDPTDNIEELYAYVLNNTWKYE